MKKLGIIICICLIALSLLPLNAFAATGILTTDTVNIYGGMEKSYGSGYSPSVADNAAHIVLPLLVDPASGLDVLDPGTGKKITASLMFDVSAASPFQAANYRKEVTLQNHPVNNNAGTQDAYLVDFTMALLPTRKNGAYPVRVKVEYTDANNAAQMQEFPVDVVVTDEVITTPTPTGTLEPTPTNTTEPTPDASETPLDTSGEVSGGGGGGGGGSTSQSQPKVLISKYTVNPSPVMAGESFDISLTLKNMSEKARVQNIKVTFKGETTDIMSAENTNSLFIDRLEKGKEQALTFKMTTRAAAEPKPQTVAIHIEYEDKDGAALTADDTITVEITQPMRVEFDEPNIPLSVNAGDTIPIKLNVFNKGRNTANNVMVTVQAEGLIPDGSGFLGNIEAGGTKSAEIYTFVGTRDMTAEAGTDTSGIEKYGPVSGIVQLTYENEYGEAFTEDIAFETVINEPVIQAVTEPEEEEPEKASQWWISALIGAGIIALLAIGFGVYRTKQKNKVKFDEVD